MGCGGGEGEADAAAVLDGSPDSDASSSGSDGGRDGAVACVPTGEEVCNGLNDDCDADADEGFILRCSPGEAEREIEAELTGDGFAEGTVRNVLRGDDRGLALPTLPRRSEYIWVASSSDNFVSKIRISDGVEVGRFVVGDNPSRTAVDGNGDAWVAMRGNLNDAGDPGEPLENVVKIDGDCTPAVMPPMATRECVLLDVPEVGNLLRGVAIDARGDAWIGAHATGHVYRLDGRTGEVLEAIALAPFARPYGLAVDERGYIWVAAIEGDVNVVRIDPAISDVDLALDSEQLGRLTPYGLAADGAGGVWFGSRTSSIFRVGADEAEVTHSYSVGSATRGVAVDDRGVVWAADSSRDALIAVDPSDGAVLFETPVGSGPVGVAVDHDGFVWAANQASDSVSRLDPITGAVLGTFPVGRNPYTYSDMTGSAFRVFQRLTGTFVGRYEVGAPGARWTRVRFEGSAPPGTDAIFRMRAGDDPGALDVAPWVDVDLSSGEAELSGLEGALLDVEVTLSTDDRSVPPPFVERLVFTVELP